MTGSRVSHYEVLEKIGAGGMGEVYLARDLRLGRKVALKLLPPDVTRDPERKQRFLREARAAAAIDHPHVGVVHEIGEDEGRTFIAMEYVRGKSLRALLAERSLTPRRALEVALQIAEGLAKLHEQGIVHRDLKPDNILVSEDGYAKIIDFGLAKLAPSPLEAREGEDGRELETHSLLRTSAGVIMGTAAYMSPEQARGAAVDARSDLFSFGIILYEMLCGRSPFRRGSLADTLSAVLNDSPPPAEVADLDGGRGDLDHVFRRLLAKEAGSRYHSMREAIVDLRDLHARSTAGAAGWAGVRGEATRPAVGVAAREAVSEDPGDATHALPHPAGKAGGGPGPAASVAAATAVAVDPVRRARRLVAAIAGAAALVVLGIVGYRSVARPGRGATGLGAGGRPAIAVLYFEDRTGSAELSWLSKGLPGMLLTGLTQTPGLDVVSLERVQEVLNGLGEKGGLEALRPGLASEVARRAGAGAMVVGSVYRLATASPQLRIDVRVDDLASGRVLAAQSVQGSDVFALADDLARRVRESLHLGESAAKPVADVTTRSVEAYRLYAQAVEAAWQVRNADAVSLFNSAVAIDPTFAMAYYQLARAQYHSDPRASEQSLRRALAHIDRLPERERLLVQAMEARRSRRPEESKRHLERLLVLHPDDETAYHELGDLLSFDLGREDQALALMQRAVQALPASGPVRNDLGYDLLGAGRYADALRAFEEYAKLSPREPNPYDSQGDVYLLLGDPERALPLYGRALQVDPTFPTRGKAWAMAGLGRYPEAIAEAGRLVQATAIKSEPGFWFIARFLHAFLLGRAGRYREAEAATEACRAASAQAQYPTGEALLRLLDADVRLERGDAAGAVREAEAARSAAAAVDPPVGPALARLALLTAAAAEARAGQSGAARARLPALAALAPWVEWERWSLPRTLEGEIALAEGHAEDAEKAFLAAAPVAHEKLNLGAAALHALYNHLAFRDGVARARAAKGDHAGAVAAYRGILAPSASAKFVPVLEPRYVLAIARLRERSGDAAGAGAEYRRFLELWSQADAGLPEVAEARGKAEAR